MKMKSWTKESVLNVAATLISDNVVVQEDWVNRHKGSDLVSDLSDIEDNYIAVMCFAPVYFMKGSITRLHINRECIRDIKVMKDFKPIFNHLFLFVDSAYVIFKKQSDGNFIELPYKYGYEKVNGTVNEFQGGLVLPLPKNSKFWIDIDGERVWIDPPKSAYENNYIDVNRNCWMDCTYFESVMGGEEINDNEMCEYCPIRDVIGRDTDTKEPSLNIKRVSNKTEQIKIGKLLEVFTPSLMRLRSKYIKEERYTTPGPSLSEQVEFLNHLKKRVKHENGILSFENSGKSVQNENIEGFNFFLLRYIVVSNNITGLTNDLDIKIYGFNTYFNLNEFIREHLGYSEGFLVFVKDENSYKETTHSLLLKWSNDSMGVSVDDFERAMELNQPRKLNIPYLCEFYEREGTLEEAENFYESDAVIIDDETLEKETPFNYNVGLCNSKHEVESLIYCRNLNDQADLIEGLIKYGYVVVNNRNVFNTIIYKYFIACRDGVGSFEMKKI
ncbi:hypothetical protein [Sinanaerobacter sp. ZZT-01]|uniref:hypothetical protein n=1 Tax=Sinanaerobacter sp. ZZT-01 TaxID=3111540 RepID=UPI002D78BE52|nr:hypothetical protein [Sinanaerobacter sp. ZZT-01]WRR92742.1 hypothetical protein U5921_11895 [Sinanaerobacter sp. ZZT-01]